jgi:Mn-containing catalase
MTREITHMRAFTAALDSMEKPQFAVGIIQPTPGLVNQFFNGSTGESQYGETDFKGPWNSGNGLHTVQSEIKRGKVWTSHPTTRSREPRQRLPSIRLRWANGQTALARSRGLFTKRRGRMPRSMRSLKSNSQLVLYHK